VTIFGGRLARHLPRRIDGKQAPVSARTDGDTFLVRVNPSAWRSSWVNEMRAVGKGLLSAGRTRLDYEIHKLQ
jgi:hypothetical protein